MKLICHCRNVTPEQRQIEDGLILFSVKDKDMLGYNNQYIGEAFISFKDIPSTSEPLSSLPQIKKWLSRPTNLGKVFKFILLKNIVFNIKCFQITFVYHWSL